MLIRLYILYTYISQRFSSARAKFNLKAENAAAVLYVTGWNIFVPLLRGEFRNRMRPVPGIENKRHESRTRRAASRVFH